MTITSKVYFTLLSKKMLPIPIDLYRTLLSIVHNRIVFFLKEALDKIRYLKQRSLDPGRKKMCQLVVHVTCFYCHNLRGRDQ
jgi:hypothetical protein